VRVLNNGVNSKLKNFKHVRSAQKEERNHIRVVYTGYLIPRLKNFTFREYLISRFLVFGVFAISSNLR